jgi:hypothetical protein
MKIAACGELDESPGKKTGGGPNETVLLCDMILLRANAGR